MDILLTLVPDLQDRISTLRPGLLVQILSVSLDSLADRIIALKVRPQQYNGTTLDHHCLLPYKCNMLNPA